jgi:hypothetical protein
VKVKIGKEISEISQAELKEVSSKCAQDLYFSTGEGLDYFHTKNRMREIRKEIKRRGSTK